MLMRILTIKKMYVRGIAIGLSLAFTMGFLYACKKGTPSKKEIMNQLEEKPQNEKNPFVSIETNHGTFIAELYREAAPKTVENFIGLATGTREFTDSRSGKKEKKPYYDNVIFHRIIPGFMIQGGDILGNGTGGPGYQFEDEINADDFGLDKLKLSEAQSYMQDSHIRMILFNRLNIKSQEDLEEKRPLLDAEYKKIIDISVKEFLTETGYTYNSSLKSFSNEKYTLSMANAGPNTNGSQFFINTADNSFLNGKHTVFGKVLKGREIVNAIEKVKTNSSNNKPLEDVVIKCISTLPEN